MKNSSSYKDLLVWQKSIDLVSDIYKLTENFPKSEMYGLSSQMQRAAVAIPSNIAEGQKRAQKKRVYSISLYFVWFGCRIGNSDRNMQKTSQIERFKI